MIPVTPRISLDEGELSFSFIRASGPGGQNVNKVSSAVQLRFDVHNSASLPESVKARLANLAGRRLTSDGVLVLTAQQYRSQERNREDAIQRLTDLIRQAAIVPKARRATRPTLGSKQRRMDAKTRRGAIKGLRQSKPGFD
jgi:ribosome-associated protein